MGRPRSFPNKDCKPALNKADRDPTPIDLFSHCLYGVTAGTCSDLTPVPIIRRHDNRRSIRRFLALSLHLCRFDPPHQIVGKSQKRPFEGLAAGTNRGTISREGLCNGTNRNRA